MKTMELNPINPYDFDPFHGKLQVEDSELSVQKREWPTV